MHTVYCIMHSAHCIMHSAHYMKWTLDTTYSKKNVHTSMHTNFHTAHWTHSIFIFHTMYPFDVALHTTLQALVIFHSLHWRSWYNTASTCHISFSSTESLDTTLQALFIFHSLHWRVLIQHCKHCSAEANKHLGCSSWKVQCARKVIISHLFFGNSDHNLVEDNMASFNQTTKNLAPI